MFKYTFVLAAFTALTAMPAGADTTHTPSAQTPSCQAAQFGAIRTEFPQASQSRGEHGDVVVKVTIGNDGRAIRAFVAQSSGFPALDKAATDSIAKHWRFDVTSCAPTELPTDTLVTVQFQRAPQYTVSGTLNTRRPTSGPKADQLPSRCDATPDSSGDQVVACVSIAPLANSAQQSLAKRTDNGVQK
jgi:TonB family protein